MFKKTFGDLLGKPKPPVELPQVELPSIEDLIKVDDLDDFNTYTEYWYTDNSTNNKNNKLNFAGVFYKIDQNKLDAFMVILKTLKV